MIKAISHVQIETSNLEKSLRFYHETLGLPVVGEITLPSGDRLIHLQAGSDGIVELAGRLEPPAPSPAGRCVGLGHLSFLVESVDEAYGQLTRQGVEFPIPPREGAGSMKRLAFCKDPDGVLIEFVEV